MAKKNDVIAREGTRFLVNKKGTVKWDELSPEALIEWTSGIEDEAVFRQWLKAGSHGQTFTIGENMILSIRL